MNRRNPRLNWDRLLDGGTYVLNLDVIGWESSVNDLRAKAHYEADKRRAVAVTHKVGTFSLEIIGKGFQARPAEGPCSCGAEPHDFHVITCTSLGRRAATAIGGQPPTPPPPVRPGTVQTRPAPQEQPPTMDVEPNRLDDPELTADQLTEADMEALLGPCSCEQSPQCQPSCSRYGG